MWNGMEGIDLTDVVVKQGISILQVGRHPVRITGAAINTDEVRKTHTLEIKYANEKGVCTQWITLNHPTSTEAVRIGLEQLKQLLILVGHTGDASPAPSWLVGKKVGISIKEEIYEGKTKTKVNYHYAPSSVELKALDANGSAAVEIDDKIPF